MSKTIDERIVEMKFDNKQFEQGAATTIKTVDKLNESLNLKGAASGLSSLEKFSKGMDLSSISDGVTKIADKFTTLGIIGVTALMNITNAAINAGKQIVASLTIDPVKQGFREYELKMGSIQTIMAGTGESLDKVNEKLNELNEYSDRTIYSFADMTTNIGKFTNAGVSLDKSVAAIQGISNAAALSGANANEASRAMYNFAQALSSGYVKLLDWKSIELANMGTVEFKQQLIDSAVAAGTLKEAGDGMYRTLKGNLMNATKGFNETLADQWMTTEALVSTLERYSDETTDIGKRAFAAAQDIKTLSQMYDTLKESAGSGWAQTSEIIIGNFEEAKALFTELGNAIGGVIQKNADARNELLQGWKDLGGRTAMIDGIRNALLGFGSIFKVIGEGFREIFPAMTAQNLFDFTKKFADLMATFKLSESTLNNIKNTFKGFFSIISIGKTILGELLKPVVAIIKYFLPFAEGALEVTGSIGEMLTQFDKAVKTTNIFDKAWEKLGKVFGPVGQVIKDVIDGIVDVFKNFKVDTSGITDAADGIVKRFQPLTMLGEVIKKVFGVIGDVLAKALPVFARLGSIVSKAFGDIWDALKESLASGNFKSIVDVFNAGVFGAILLKLKDFMGSFKDITKGAGIIDQIKGIFDGLTGTLKTMQQDIKANTILKIAAALGILTISVVALSTIDSAKLTMALTAIAIMFAELFGSMAIFEKIMGSKGFASMGKVTTAMLALSTAVLILSVALKNIAELSWDEIVRGLAGVAGLAAILVVSAKSLSKSEGKLIKGALGLIAFAAAMLILTKAVKELGNMPIVNLTKGLIAVGVLMTELALFLKFTDFEGLSIGKGIALIALAGALNIMAIAVEKFGNINIVNLVKGLGALGVILTELALFVNLTGNAKNVISTAIGLGILAGAMLIFTEVVDRLGQIPFVNLAKGLAGLGTALGIITLAVNFMPKNMISIGLGMIALSAALLLITNSLDKIGGMSLEKIGKGLLGLGGSLLIIALAVNAMKGAMAGAAALLVVAGALAILTPVLGALGNMSLVEIGSALLVLAGVFGILGIAGLLLGPMVPVILSLAGAIAVLGVGLLAVGAGVMLFATGLGLLAVAGTGAAAALVVIVTSLISLIPMLIENIGIGLVAFATVIRDSAPVILEAITAVLMGLIGAFVTVVPALVDAIFVFITTMLTTFATHLPVIIQAGIDILMAFLQGIRDNIPQIVDVVIAIIVNFVAAIVSQMPVLVTAAFDMILGFIDALTLAVPEYTPKLVTAIVELGAAIVQGLVDGLIAGVGAVGNAIVELGKSALDGLKSFLGIHSPSREFMTLGEYSSAGFANGITSETGSITESLNIMSTQALALLQGKIPQFMAAGMNLAIAISTGIRNGTPQVVISTQTLIQMLLQLLIDAIPPFNLSGMALIQGLTMGMELEYPNVMNSINNLMSKCIEAVRSQRGGFEGAGRHIISGIASGIYSGASEAINAAIYVAGEALAGAKKTLGIKSPSREFMKVGMYADQGMAEGLLGYSGVVTNASKSVGQQALSTMESTLSKVADSISNNMDSNPTIRPVVDLTDVEAGATRIGTLMNKKSSISVSGLETRVKSIANGILNGEVKKSPVGKSDGSAFYYEQNIYSPKAISPSEVYRNTSNQFTEIKEAMDKK